VRVEEAKHKNAQFVLELACCFILTNDVDAVDLKDIKQRRFIILRVDPSRAKDTEYFQRLTALLNDEEFQVNWFKFLMARDLSLYKRNNPDGEEIKEEDRYAQFVEFNGIRSPFIVDRFTNGKHASRINYESIEFNHSFSDSIFAKPSSAKEAKKGVKY